MKSKLVLGAAAVSLFTFVTPAFAIPAYSSSSSAGGNVDIVCVQGYVATRESALMSAWSSYASGMTSAYDIRKAALASAWGTTEAAARRTAVKAAWTTFRSSKKVTVKSWNDTRKSAWKAFRQSVKACKGAATETAVESAGEANDQ